MELNTSKYRSKQVALFLLLTYMFSWSVFAIGHSLENTPIIILGVWGPSIIAIALTLYFYGKKGLIDFLSRFKRSDFKLHWWFVLLLLPAFVHFIGLSIWQLYSSGSISPNILPVSRWIGPIIGSFIIAGLGEELGWRGFMLPRLQKKNTALKAAIILGTFHLLWHLPTYWLGQGIHNVPAIYAVGFLYPWTIIFVWLYNKSNGSLAFSVGFHSISNASLAIVNFMPPQNEVPISPDLITMVSIHPAHAGRYLSVVLVYMIVAALVLKFGNFNKVNTDLP